MVYNVLFPVSVIVLFSPSLNCPLISSPEIVPIVTPFSVTISWLLLFIVPFTSFGVVLEPFFFATPPHKFKPRDNKKLNVPVSPVLL